MCPPCTPDQAALSSPRPHWPTRSRRRKSRRSSAARSSWPVATPARPGGGGRGAAGERFGRAAGERLRRHRPSGGQHDAHRYGHTAGRPLVVGCGRGRPGLRAGRARAGRRRRMVGPGAAGFGPRRGTTRRTDVSFGHLRENPRRLAPVGTVGSPMGPYCATWTPRPTRSMSPRNVRPAVSRLPCACMFLRRAFNDWPAADIRLRVTAGRLRFAVHIRADPSRRDAAGPSAPGVVGRRSTMPAIVA